MKVKERERMILIKDWKLKKKRQIKSRKSLRKCEKIKVKMNGTKRLDYYEYVLVRFIKF